MPLAELRPADVLDAAGEDLLEPVLTLEEPLLQDRERFVEGSRLCLPVASGCQAPKPKLGVKERSEPSEVAREQRLDVGAAEQLAAAAQRFCGAIDCGMPCRQLLRLYAFTVVPRAPNFCALRRVSSKVERA